MGLLAFYVFCGLCCLVCLVAFYLAVPKMLFRDHLFACRGTALGLNPAGDPVFRNHARPCLTVHFVGLLAFYVFCALCCLVCLLALHLAVPKMLFRDHLFACLGTALGLNPAGDPVFRNHAPPCSTGLFHGPSSLLYVFCGLCCLVCLLALYVAVPKMLFRDHLFACRGTALDLNPAGDPVFRNHAPPCSTKLFHGPSSLLWFLCLVLPCLPCSLV